MKRNLYKEGLKFSNDKCFWNLSPNPPWKKPCKNRWNRTHFRCNFFFSLCKMRAWRRQKAQFPLSRATTVILPACLVLAIGSTPFTFHTGGRLHTSCSFAADAARRRQASPAKRSQGFTMTWKKLTKSWRIDKLGKPLITWVTKCVSESEAAKGSLCHKRRPFQRWFVLCTG